MWTGGASWALPEGSGLQNEFYAFWPLQDRAWPRWWKRFTKFCCYAIFKMDQSWTVFAPSVIVGGSGTCPCCPLFPRLWEQLTANSSSVSWKIGARYPRPKSWGSGGTDTHRTHVNYSHCHKLVDVQWFCHLIRLHFGQNRYLLLPLTGNGQNVFVTAKLNRHRLHSDAVMGSLDTGRLFSLCWSWRLGTYASLSDS